MKISSAVSGRGLFGLLALVEALHCLYLCLTHRFPLGHDGLQYFSLQYFFLDDAAVNHEVPLWIPYMNHGVPAAWHYTVQGSIGLLANALLLAGGWLSHFNFLHIFHAGILVDRLLLLAGTWALSQYYFESALTSFFVTCCVMGSTVAMTQFDFTLHLYYAIPLIIYFGHLFLDSGRWLYFFLSVNLFVIQCFGKIGYIPSIIALTVFLYFLFFALDQPGRFNTQIKYLRFGLPSTAAISASLLSLGVLAAIFAIGKDPAMVNLNGGRNADSSVGLDIFLTYGQNLNFNKWQELLLRISPSLDNTLYMGLLAVPLVFFGLFYNPSRYKLPIVLTALILLFFSLGTWVSVFFYYTWPMMKFYRHLSLMSPLIKFLLIFLAGFGFEALFIRRHSWQGRKIVSYSCLGAGALFLLLSTVLSTMSSHGLDASHYIVRFLTVQTSQTPSTFDPFTISLRLKEASALAFLISLVFLFLPIVPFKKYGPAIVLAVLLINAADIFGYYCTETNERTFVLSHEQYKTTDFTKMPYAKRRLIDAPNPRKVILASPAGHLTVYATVNAFLLEDALASRFRTFGRLQPLHDLVSSFGPKVLENKTFLDIAGSTQDKIQFYSRAPGKSLLNGTDRLILPYRVLKFTPNILEVSVNAPLNPPVWMVYADVWHWRWKAEVNGKAVGVLKANLAYKAVQLVPGPNAVKFYYYSPKTVFLQKTVSLNAFLWIMLLFYLMAAGLANGKNPKKSLA